MYRGFRYPRLALGDLDRLRLRESRESLLGRLCDDDAVARAASLSATSWVTTVVSSATLAIKASVCADSVGTDLDLSVVDVLLLSLHRLLLLGGVIGGGRSPGGGLGPVFELGTVDTDLPEPRGKGQPGLPALACALGPWRWWHMSSSTAMSSSVSAQRAVILCLCLCIHVEVLAVITSATASA